MEEANQVLGKREQLSVAFSTEQGYHAFLWRTKGGGMLHELNDQPKLFNVSPRDREPLLVWIETALLKSGCRIIYRSSARKAPFRFTFETPVGERLGIIAYAFLANSTMTKNRPADEHRFQVKYGAKTGEENVLWQDPYGLYTTLFFGIDPELGIFVGADPVLHSPTKFFISIEFKNSHVQEILRKNWHAWERERRSSNFDSPIEVLVGGTAEAFLNYIKFEREALCEDQGHRQLIAERIPGQQEIILPEEAVIAVPTLEINRLHSLAQEFELSEFEVLDLIGQQRRLKMAVRGWVAEKHLYKELEAIPGVEDLAHLDEEGGPDLRLRFEGSRPLAIECKNVLRLTTKNNEPRMDFQRTRASKFDPCSRYYGIDDFDVVAACLHAVTEKWQYKYIVPSDLAGHKSCIGKLSNNVKVDDKWTSKAQEVLRIAAGR